VGEDVVQEDVDKRGGVIARQRDHFRARSDLDRAWPALLACECSPEGKALASHRDQIGCRPNSFARVTPQLVDDVAHGVLDCVHLCGQALGRGIGGHPIDVEPQRGEWGTA
jgi:hypothetical protein